MRLPHILSFNKSPLIFFTACTEERQPVLACAEAQQVLTQIWQQSAEHDGWYVGRFVLMPGSPAFLRDADVHRQAARRVVQNVEISFVAPANTGPENRPAALAGGYLRPYFAQ